jgi:hypothetical protein
LDETTTSRFSAKKLTLVEKEKAISRCEYPWEDFEEVLDIYDAFASDTVPIVFTRDFLVRKISN